MVKTASKIRFKAKLLQPAASRKVASWTFLTLPKGRQREAPLPSQDDRRWHHQRPSISGHARARRPKQPLAESEQKDTRGCRRECRRPRHDGDRGGSQRTGPRIPADLRKALDAAPEARALWLDITAIARRDWIHWIESAKQTATRGRRIDNACSMLGAGKRRVCCFDRSGIYSKAFNSPKAAEVS